MNVWNMNCIHSTATVNVLLFYVLCTDYNIPFSPLRHLIMYSVSCLCYADDTVKLGFGVLLISPC